MAGRSELLGWINSTLDLRLGKVEETASGAVACQMMDALHPGIVPMKKVDFNAKGEHEYINNYKVLQEVFNKLSVDKHVEVSKLVKARPLDNLEFMQWMKAYFDQHTGGRGVHDYDGLSRRALCKTGDARGAGSGAGGGAARAASTPVPAPRDSVLHTGGSAAGRLTSAIAAQPPVAPKRMVSAGTKAAPAAGSMRSAAAPAGSIAGRSRGPSTDGAMEPLAAEVAKWRAAADTMAKEKDFYWSKLRAIELLCNTCADVPVLRVVENILYAPSEEEGERLLGEAMAELEARSITAAPGVADAAVTACAGSAGADATAALQASLQEVGFSA